MASRVRFERRGRFRASPEALWPLLADTRNLNAAVGLPPIDYAVTPLETGGSHVEAAIRVAGIPVARWTEHPFLWRAPYAYAVCREFAGGPFRSASVGVELAPGDETEVLAYAEFEPRNVLGTAILRAGLGQRAVDQIIAQCSVFDRYVAGGERTPFPTLAPRGARAERVRALAAGLMDRAVERRIVERLVAHLADGRDDELVKMRPFELADRWDQDRRSVLAAFLQATVSGLVTMAWDVLCPNCRVGKNGYSSLRQLEATAHCASCNIAFDAEFDRLVEVRFTIAPAIRAIVDRDYCIGGPMNTPHVAVQVPLGPGEAREVACRLEVGAYRTRSPHAASATTIHVVDGEAADTLELRVTTDTVVGDRRTLGPGRVKLVVRNDTPHRTTVAVEGHRWPDTVATAAVVSTLPEFRDLFSSEVLAPGLQLGIRRLTFMFTDLTGSTALYQAVGQARAFRIVQDQFAILAAAIEAHRGAVVKTIGDAVMATFETGADGLAAAMAIQRDIRRLRLDGAVDPGRLVKIGLHQGPCVAVTLNDRLDYFGTTVNVAARVEHEARGGDIVATADVYDGDDAQTILAAAAITCARERVHLRGIREPVSVVRIRVP